MTPPPYRHVIWDWNGTLFDDADLCVACMNRLLAARGLPLLTRARYQELFDFPVIEYYRRLGFDFDREPFERLGTAFIEDYERRKLACPLRPGARRALETVRAAGLTQSVLSAYRQDSLEELLRHFGLRGFFLGIAGARDHYAHGKEAAGRAWLRRLGLPPASILLIGDTAHDVEVARALGTDCRLIPGGNQSRARLERSGAPVCDRLADAIGDLPGRAGARPLSARGGEGAGRGHRFAGGRAGRRTPPGPPAPRGSRSAR